MQNDESTAKAIHAVVHGRVQGVGFRYWARSSAVGLGLTGWVRNCDDGTVEVFFQGKSPHVERFAQLLEQGPPGASVSRVEARTVSPRKEYTRFSITV